MLSAKTIFQTYRLFLVTTVSLACFVFVSTAFVSVAFVSVASAQADSTLNTTETNEALFGDLVAEIESNDPNAFQATIKECIAFALERNYDIRQAKERIERERNVKLESRAPFYPSLGIEGNYSQIDKDRISAFDGTVFGDDRNWTADVIARYQIYNGGRDAAQLKRAKLLERSAEHEYQAVLNDVIQQVKERFYAVLLAKSQLEVQKQDTLLLEEELRSEKSRYSAGTVSEFTVLRADVALANSRTPLVRSRNDLKLAYEELRRVVGFGGEDVQEPQKPFRLIGTLECQPFAITLDQALSTAIEKRPELQQARVRIEAEQQGVRIEQADYLPKLSVYGSYGADKSRFENDLGEEVHGWTAGAVTQWNLFDGLRTNSRVAQARATESLAHLAFEQTQQSVNIEVRRVFSSLVEARELVNVSRKVVKQAAESLRLARARQDVGAGTQIETLDSQVALTEARTNEIKALHDYNIAYSRMIRAVGGDESLVRGSSKS